jgi:hypothetical protein
MTLRSCPIAEPASRRNLASRSSAAVALWGLLTAASILLYCLLTAGPAGARLIYGWFIGLSLIRVIPLAALLLGGIGLAMMLRSMGLAPRIASLATILAADWRRRSPLLIAAGIALSLGVVGILRAFPNSGDSYSYLFEAGTFVAGRLWNPPPAVRQLFEQYQIVLSHSKWFSAYPPGWPLILSGALTLDLPAWLVSPLCGGLLLFAVLALGMRRDGPLGGLLAAALVALSPFFLFNAASYFNHVPAAAAGLLFCWAASAFLDKPKVATALLSGAALGALGLIRTVDVPIFALPFAIEFVWRARALHYRRAPAIALAGLPFLALLMLFYYEISGSSLPSAGPVSRFGLSPVDEHGHHFNFFDQLSTVLVRLVSLAEWTSPLLVLGFLAAFVLLVARRRLSMLDLVFPAFVVAYLLIPFDGANQYGPRYYFEAFPFAVLTLVAGLTPVLKDAARSQRQAFAWFLLIAHGALSVVGFVFISYWMRTLVDQRMDLYDQVHAQHLHNAVVVVHSSTSSIYPMKPRDLVRNGIEVGGDVIYALDVPDRLPELQREFPQRRFYIYQREVADPVGSLQPLNVGSGSAPHG